jgi:hypothetical protein
MSFNHLLMSPNQCFMSPNDLVISRNHFLICGNHFLMSRNGHATCKPCRAAGHVCRVARENSSAYCSLVVFNQSGAGKSLARRWNHDAFQHRDAEAQRILTTDAHGCTRMLNFNFQLSEFAFSTTNYTKWNCRKKVSPSPRCPSLAGAGDVLRPSDGRRCPQGG